MFGVNEKRKPDSKIEAYLGAGTEFEGNITTKGTLRIDGKWEGGKIVADGVIVGETGSIKGDIHAKSIIVGGTVSGNLVGQELVEIHPHARVIGDIATPQLSITEGAFFKGNCLMNERFQESPASDLQPVIRPVHSLVKEAEPVKA